MRKQLLILFSALLICACPALAADVSITVDAGILSTLNGAATLPEDSLLLLIADPATTSTVNGPVGVFPAPNPGSFVGGDNIVIAAFGFDDTQSGVAGETNNDPSFSYTTVGGAAGPASSSTFDVGDKIELRWYYGYTYTNYQNNVQLATGETYGMYTTTGTTAPDGGVNFVGPPPGSYSGINAAGGLNFFTASDNPPMGTVTNPTPPDTAGQADTAVVALAVPEPSSAMSLGLGALMFAAFAMRKRQAREKLS